MELEDLVGQKLVIGIPGKTVTPEIVRQFGELRAGGLILYRINFDSPAQIRKLISDLEEALGRKLLVCADHEGGRVIMFRDGITVFPDNLALGTTKKIAYARRQGAIEAKELRRLGIDVNLGPVLDVLTNAYSPNIGIRSYGKDWKLVAAMGTARIRAMQSGGLSACAKHFPGKGHAPVDAHLGLPAIRSTWQEMETVHLKPFRAAVKAGVDLVMSSHPYYPNLDPEPNMIATFSRKIIHDTLRTEMGFKGVISSDDLEMGAIKAICPIGEAAVRTAEAGHDLLLVCHDPAAQRDVSRALLWGYRSKKLSLKELEESVERIAALKEKRKKRFAPGALRPERGGARLAEKICGESASLLAGRIPPLQGKRVAVIFPRISSFDSKIMVEKEILDETSFLKLEFGRYKIRPEVKIVPIEPSDAEMESCRALFAADHVICFCFDAHLYPSNKKLLDLVQNSCRSPIIVTLRDPYDEEFVRNGIPVVTDFGWRACQIRAVIARLCRSRRG